MTVETNDNSAWRAFEESELTHSAAHYLMTIMNLRKTNGYARVTDVAEHLQVSRGAASRAISLFKERGWIAEDHNRMLGLTDEGVKLARRVERNYLVLECFLEDILGVDGNVAREDACKLEHLLSPVTSAALFRLIRVLTEDRRLLQKLKEKMDAHEMDCDHRTQLCPLCSEHDTCIVEQSGGDLEDLLTEVDVTGNKSSATLTLTLAELQSGQKAFVTRVGGEGDAHRRILDMGISKGVMIEVEQVAPLKDPIKIRVRGYALTLRKREAQLIEVEEALAEV